MSNSIRHLPESFPLYAGQPIGTPCPKTHKWCEVQKAIARRVDFPGVFNGGWSTLYVTEEGDQGSCSVDFVACFDSCARVRVCVSEKGVYMEPSIRGRLTGDPVDLPAGLTYAQIAAAVNEACVKLLG